MNLRAVAIRPVTRRVQRAAVAAWHSHHARSTPGERLALGAFVDDDLVAVVVMGSPPRYTASRLLGAAGRVMDGAGVTRQVSYTRVDERGSCYLAANWRPVEVVRGRGHTTGNRSCRWLPGLYDPGTEIVDRVRWERGERARPSGCRWDGKIWEIA